MWPRIFQKREFTCLKCKTSVIIWPVVKPKCRSCGERMIIVSYPREIATDIVFALFPRKAPLKYWLNQLISRVLGL